MDVVPVAVSEGRPLRVSVGAALRVAVAHHPLCHAFRQDVFRIGGIGFCRGCALALPSFVAGLLGGFAAWGAGAEPFVLIVVGLALGVPQLTTTLHRGGGAWRAVVKLSGGSGLGLLFIGLVTSGLPIPALVGAVVLLGAAFLALQLIRVHKMLGTCRACPWKMDWDRCPGFGGL